MGEQSGFPCSNCGHPSSAHAVDGTCPGIPGRSYVRYIQKHKAALKKGASKLTIESNPTDREELAYKAGFEDAIGAFAWWQNGIELVGSGNVTKESVLKDVRTILSYTPRIADK